MCETRGIPRFDWAWPAQARLKSPTPVQIPKREQLSEEPTTLRAMAVTHRRCCYPTEDLSHIKDSIIPLHNLGAPLSYPFTHKLLDLNFTLSSSRGVCWLITRRRVGRNTERNGVTTVDFLSDFQRNKGLNNSLIHFKLHVVYQP